MAIISSDVFHHNGYWENDFEDIFSHHEIVVEGSGYGTDYLEDVFSGREVEEELDLSFMVDMPFQRDIFLS